MARATNETATRDRCQHCGRTTFSKRDGHVWPPALRRHEIACAARSGNGHHVDPDQAAQKLDAKTRRDRRARAVDVAGPIAVDLVTLARQATALFEQGGALVARVLERATILETENRLLRGELDEVREAIAKLGQVFDANTRKKRAPIDDVLNGALA